MPVLVIEARWPTTGEAKHAVAATSTCSSCSNPEQPNAIGAEYTEPDKAEHTSTDGAEDASVAPRTECTVRDTEHSTRYPGPCAYQSLGWWYIFCSGT